MLEIARQGVGSLTRAKRENGEENREEKNTVLLRRHSCVCRLGSLLIFEYWKFSITLQTRQNIFSRQR